jgi:hypothetical protein
MIDYINDLKWAKIVLFHDKKVTAKRVIVRLFTTIIRD